MKDLIKETFKVTYVKEGMNQTKNLISQEDYEEKVKPILKEIQELESKQSEYNKKNKKYQELEKEIRTLKGKLKPLGEWFTSRSPLGKALENGGLLILPSQQGGTHKVEFTKEEIV